MKRAMVIGASFCMLCVTVYGSFFSPQSYASNNSEIEEYYYNEEEREKMEGMEDAMTAGANTSFIDTEPDSLTVLVNKEFVLPAEYVPEDLVVPKIRFSFSEYKQKKLMRQEAAQALERLFEGAEEAGVSLFGVSGYRSYDRQKDIYERNVAQKGREQTDLFSARPGSSEHQTGLAMDISTGSIHYRLDEEFAGTPEGRFLADHAHEYGFIIRYPKEKSDITGYAYEPWHIRYVGEPLAKELYERGITLEEYYHYTPSQELQGEEAYGTAVDVEQEE